MSKNLPRWALQPATPQDRDRAEQSYRAGTLQIAWPDHGALRAWAHRHAWPTPWLASFEDAFVRKMLDSDEAFALALHESGIALAVPVPQHTISAEQLTELDALYAERSSGGRPTSCGNLVEALREIRRAVEAGVVVEVEGRRLESFGSFYTWAHGRYHMLEDGYDSWIGDDRS